MFANKSHALAYEFHLKKDFPHAIEHYNAAIEESPEHPDCYGDRAFCLLQMGEIDKSLADFSQAITLQPTYGFRYSCRGFVYQVTQKSDLATADYKQALALDPTESIALHNSPQLQNATTAPLANPWLIRAKILSSYLEFQKRFPTIEDQKKFLHFLRNGAQNK